MKDKTFTKTGNFGHEFADHLSQQSKTGRQWNHFKNWNYDLPGSMNDRSIKPDFIPDSSIGYVQRITPAGNLLHREQDKPE
jgi:hypothetical protein